MIYDVVIVGGGHMGIAFGIMLARAGLQVMLVERRAIKQYVPNGDPARLLAISNGSINSYLQHGINLDFDKLGEQIKKIITIETGALEGYLEFNPNDIGLENFGYMIEEQDLAYALYSYSKNVAGFSAIYNASVVDLDQSGSVAQVILENGESIKANLIIAADGKHSKIRDILGIEADIHDYKQYALVFDVRHEKPHAGIAIEKFMPTGPFASLPKIGGFTSSVVWTVPESAYSLFNNVKLEEMQPLIDDRFGGCFGKVELASSIKMFKLEQVIAQKYYEGRVALLGDALHSVHPLAGQGLNLSMRDAEALCALIVEQKSLGLDIGSQIMLESYANLRKVDNTMMSESTHFINTLFSNDMRVVRGFRKTGLNIVNASTKLKNAFMRYAAGE